MKHVFEMIPPSGPGYGAVFALALILLAGLLALFAWVGYSAPRHTRFEVSSEALTIRAALYGRSIPMSDLAVEDAMALDLKTETERCPSWRTSGISLPGYGAGWFRLRGGGKALVFLTDRSSVVYIPTRRDYSLLLSVASPAEFVEALRAAAGRPAG